MSDRPRKSPTFFRPDRPAKGGGKPRGRDGHKPGKPRAGHKGASDRNADSERAPGIDARIVALDLLNQVLVKEYPLDERLEQDRGFNRLSPRDRAFAYRLVLTVLRRAGSLDALLEACLDRPKDLREHDVRQLMRLGAAQLLFLETPAHAAINTSLDVADARKLSRVKGLVNAVLRRLSREGDALLTTLDKPGIDTPEWLWQGWQEHYGKATAAKLAVAHRQEPGLDITIKSNAKRDELITALDATPLPNGSLRRPVGGNITKLPGFDTGDWWVQDAAASMPARLFGDDLKGQRIADLCAAPGGKTCQLAAAGAEVTALDRSGERLVRLGENLRRLGLARQVETITANAKTWHTDTPFDGVLLDAPCSATGTIRRHPDVPWLKDPDQIDALAEQQAELLGQSIDLVKRRQR
ncbi:MAG: transcription antitermination factor NusB, partial [Pseudomonadota bacterium]